MNNSKEYDRLKFVENRDGIHEAYNFAKRTLDIYRKCVLKKFYQTKRKDFIESYLSFKEYCKMYENGLIS